jgi:coenzyme F420-0:L-glutamate ligase/coenzyme F420-1:gamma-L-glutamate ligase
VKDLKQLVLTALPDIPMVQTGDDLVKIILDGLTKAEIQLLDHDTIVIAQKIVSKSEGRWVNLVSVQPSQRAIELGEKIEKDPRLVELILSESNQVLRIRLGTVIVEHKLGFVCANAGIDHSNVAGMGSNTEEWVLLLPENPDASAQKIRSQLEALTAARIGVMIIDSHGRAWREGVLGVAIGLAGLPGIVDMRGKPDLFGYKLRITTIGAADELAAAASLVMGQAREATPIVHVRGFPYDLREGNLRELLRPKEQDLFR